MSNCIELHTDHAMLTALQCISHPRIPLSRFDKKIDEYRQEWSAVLETRDQLRAQTDWPFFFGMLWRNKPDDRGMITTLQNQDTFNAILAVRAGIEVSTAIALAYHDLIFSMRLDCRDGSDGRALDASLCGTFSLAGAGQMFRYALFANSAARFYRPEYHQDELILMHQCEEAGLFWGRDYYSQSIIHRLWDHSTKDFIEVEPHKDAGGQQDG